MCQQQYQSEVLDELKQKENKMASFEDLRTINVNDHVEKKNGLTYLSWAWAWDIFKQKCPEATYKVIKTTDGLPYFESSAGVMVYTEVTANNITHEMWLPVMDGANKAMKREAYNYKTKYADKTCDAFDMFDVNKTIMRCLVKNLAMFGLGIYIYAGEDLPDKDSSKQIQDSKPALKSVQIEDFDSDEQDFLRDTATQMIAFIASEQVKEAHGLTVSLDNDEKLAIWGLLDSKTRTAIKKYSQSINSIKEI